MIFSWRWWFSNYWYIKFKNLFCVDILTITASSLSGGKVVKNPACILSSGWLLLLYFMLHDALQVNMSQRSYTTPASALIFTVLSNCNCRMLWRDYCAKMYWNLQDNWKPVTERSSLTKTDGIFLFSGGAFRWVHVASWIQWRMVTKAPWPQVKWWRWPQGSLSVPRWATSSIVMSAPPKQVSVAERARRLSL